MSLVSRKALLALALALTLAGCPRQITRDDAGSPPTPDAGPPELTFDGPIALDDARVAQLDPSTLPAGATPCMDPVLATVYRISDGDTIHIRATNPVLDTKVRFIGVDAPEVAHPPDPTPADCYGDDASEFTSQLLNHQVWLTFDNTCHDTYGRLLAYVHVASGDAGFWQRQLLRRGYAHVLTVGDNRRFEPVFESDEAYADMAGAGLWTACF